MSGPQGLSIIGYAIQVSLVRIRPWTDALPKSISSDSGLNPIMSFRSKVGGPFDPAQRACTGWNRRIENHRSSYVNVKASRIGRHNGLPEKCCDFIQCGFLGSHEIVHGDVGSFNTDQNRFAGNFSPVDVSTRTVRPAGNIGNRCRILGKLKSFGYHTGFQVQSCRLPD